MRRVLQPDERRAELLTASRAVFASRGYHASGIGDIVKRVGCSRGTFYNYFDSKREVFAAVLSEMMTEVVGVIEPIDVQRDIAEQVRANLERLVSAIMAEDVLRVLFSEAAGIDDEGDEALRSFYSGATQRIETALKTGQTLGVVRAGDTRLLARCLLGLLKEPVFQARLYNEPIDVHALSKELLSLISGGLLRPLQH
ncbi:MAG: TetR/AcrR family transcriptional regulator [Proteobacteria bacterium]|nr:TetR/AcrR family transcriptional regulator [Pseudomonadota bacterium]